MAGRFLVVIGGPTAVGKTRLAIELARYYDCEIVSADGRQFYREMNIGTAKPTEEELALVKHHFINTHSVTELYGAGHFEKEAIPLIDQLLDKQGMCIMVGGSGLYINAVLNGVDEFPEVPAQIREELNAAFAKQGLGWLQDTLKQCDETYYHKVDLNNPQRLIRAIEVFKHTGKPFSSYLNQTSIQRTFTTIPLFITMDREALYERINQRVEAMMRQGLENEVRALLPFRNCNALKTVGYSELFDYLDGTVTLETAVEKIKQRTRQYAKRQITWFKNQGDFEAFDPENVEQIKAYIDIIRQHA